VEINFDDDIFNDAYRPLLKNQDRYLLLYGGRGSGKSIFAAQKLIVRCLNEKFFRYILVRKTYESIKDSQYQVIKDLCTEYKIDHLFTFRVSPLSIECINGNKIICKGLDKPEKTKSVSEPTGIWYEEASELTEEDFIASTTSIRTTKANYLQEIFTFNPESPEADYHDFWIYRKWFKDKPMSFSSEIDIELPGGEIVKSRYTALHTDYTTNINNLPKEYIALLEDYKDFNYYYYLVFTKGLWGNQEIKSPFCFSFDKDKHSGKTIWDANLETYLSFDFNKEPLTCLIAQKPEYGQLRCIENIFVSNVDIDEICDIILSKYPNALFLVTGDQTGDTSTAIKKGLTYYRKIKENLSISSGQVFLPGKNPLHRISRIEVNMLLHKSDILFDPVNCKETIADCMIVEYDTVKLKIIKDNRSDDAQKADFLDCFRYLVSTFMRDELRLLGLH